METIKVLKKSIRDYKLPSIITPVFIIGEVVLETLIPMIMARLIDEISAGVSMQPIIKYGLILLAMALASLFCGFVAGKFAAEASCGFAKNLRHDLYYKVQDFSFADIDRFSTSSLVTRLTTDVTNVQNSYQMIIRIAIRTPMLLIFSFVFSFRISWKISLIFLAAMPVIGVALFIMMKVVMPFFRKIFRKYDNMNESVQENVQAIRVVKSFVREEHEKEKFDKVSSSVKKDFTKAERILALCWPIMMICIYTVISFIVFYGSKTIITTNSTGLTTGDLSALINYAIQALMSMMMLSMVIVMITMSAESANRIKEVLVTEPSLKNPENGIKTVDNGDITFENVSFKYSEKAEKNALENINLSIKSGETIGILGGTGSSKTTLVQLIPRLYDVSEGRLLVGDRDVRDYDLETLRDAVSMVLQKNVLFSGTIKENIRWGNKDASDEEIERVCRLACADDFIESFPDKYDTYIEQGGTNVSGGQKQRLCIARALIKKPKILILDDSTSAVDTKTDAKIRKAFREEIPDTTKIIIAQRVASVEDADKIIVMDGGRIADAGTHDELMERCEEYRSVYESQTRRTEGGDVQ
ncbi:MAG: ABC transporter ATP-binding protein [Eubacteriales bacterium]|nr:ABC transporter ATP-binding protein/permease [Christensenellaceae bacterium]MDD7091744.1 ABC transporter ATP-binding protein [Christensenellaceae bacterium]MDY3241990.1 ABC transporter ATP-binding protein [Eubacteriales bacterium]